MGSLDEGAIAAHELFESFVRAGFTEEQAMQIVTAQIIAAATQNGGQP